MPTRDIADQLRDYQRMIEATGRTIDDLKEQRNLITEVAKQAKLLNLEFNETTQNIGKSVNELSKLEILTESVSNITRNRISVERNLINLLSNKSSLQKEINELNDIDQMDAALRVDNFDREIKGIWDKLILGKIEMEQAVKLEELASKKWINTGNELIKKKESLNLNEKLIGSAIAELDLQNDLLDKEKRRLDFHTRLSNLSNKIKSDFGELGTYFSKSVTPAKVFFDILDKGYENFKLFDKSAVTVRQTLGLLPGEAKLFENNIKTLGIEMMHLGASFEDIARSITSITSELPGFVSSDKELLKTTTALSKQFGISESTSVKFFKTLGGISGESANSQRSISGFAKQLASSANIPIGQLMEDVANASDDVRLFTSQSAISLVKAAAQARMMGIDLSKAASSAQKLLQFESSISSELKASALLGQNINFNYARQLSFNKDIIGANNEILKIAKQVNFNQLNPIQQQAFAEAAGKSVGELQDMLQQEKNIALVKNGSNEQAKKALADYEKMIKMKEDEAKDVGKLAEQEIIRKANQEKLLQIQNKFNQLMSQLAQPVMEIVEPLLDLAISVMPTLTDGIKLGIILFKPLSILVTKIGTSISMWVGKISTFIGPLTKSQGILLKIGKFLLPFAGFFGKWLTPIGYIITAFQVIGSIFKQWKKYVSDFEGPIWKKILRGVQAVTSGILRGLFGPFEFLIDYLDKWFFGKSPSKLGLMILKGIKSVSGLILDALTWPFTTFWNNTAAKIPGIGEIGTPSEAMKLSGGVEGNVSANLPEFDKIDTPSEAMKLSGGVEGNVSAKIESDNELISVIQSGNQAIVQKISELINMMANGGIAVNLDGQKLNYALQKSSYIFGDKGQATNLIR